MRVTQLIARGLLCPLFTLTALVTSAAMTMSGTSTTSLAAPRLEGTGGTLTFQIEGTDPARFFKVEVLARGAE